MKCYKHFPVQVYELYTTVTVLCCNPRCQYSAAICDLSNVVAFGHNELWRPKAAKLFTKLAKKSPNSNAAKTV